MILFSWYKKKKMIAITIILLRLLCSGFSLLFEQDKGNDRGYIVSVRSKEGTVIELGRK